ncbi:hypothetical protein PS627_01482 [Pseudomonas fluorescens]|uniref:helix-turn-helix domain-containing protein n=1 Tax=Pseudomonas fluorescens TaxID=294 RepID=UPI0012571DFB|nr:helix-turn-helix domain-containing protein [Pseudomonas fluorescens]CAG8865564.1 hypothetical protein PS627_01482 [Pseudomonas fluorescens]VVP86192.1 hypothetical protein PS910_02429 [Pseudomonas fluorescens]
MSRCGFAVIARRLKQITGTTSDAALAKVLEISPQTLSSWKSRNRIPYSLCVEIAMREGVSLDWLLLGEGAQQRALSQGVSDASEDWHARLLSQLQALNPCDLQAVALIVEDKHRIRRLEQRLAELKNSPAVLG